MADYPQQSHYGASYGQTNSPYQPPLYPNQYTQPNDGHTADSQYMPNYNQNMGAYGYNAAMPGFNAAAPGSTSTPLPIYRGWNQDPIPLPSYTAPQNSIPNNGYSAPSFNNYIPPYSSLPQAAYPQDNLQKTQAAKTYDESDGNSGSNSNGYSAPAVSHTPYSAKASPFPANDGNGYTDTAHRAVYARNQDAAPPQRSRPDSRNRRQQSGSYSPYDDRAPTQQYVTHALGQTVKNGQKNKQSRAPKTSVNPPPTSTQAAKAHGQTLARVITPAQQVQSVQPIQQVNGIAYKSVAEARKKGQGAVLNLYPLDVRYQQYVDEGFDAAIIGRLFDDLGLSREASNKKDSGLTGKDEIKDTQEGNATPKVAADLSSIYAQPASPGGASIGSSIVATAPVKSALAVEKERTLQMKMEALRKSREERAKNAAAKNIPKSLTALVASAPAPAPSSAMQPEPAKPEPAVIAPTDPTSSTIHDNYPPKAVPVVSTVSIPPVQTQVEVNTPITKSPAPSMLSQSTSTIPGLFMGSSGQRKRPVAADFDTALTITPHKRPFGQSRSSNTSVVIHVSEDEGDSEDEDIEMDLESMADQDSPKQPPTRKLSEQRNNALQNFPQLSNFPARKPYTPTQPSSTASTPPSFQALRKPAIPKPDGLREKEMAIEEMRRKIAEAEARKKAQQASNGSRTPRSSSIIAEKQVNNEITAAKVEAAVKMQQVIEMVEDKATADKQRLAEIQTIEIQKSADLKRDEAEVKRLRRQKIATDLPRVDAEVEEKQRKLEQLRVQMAEMEAEVQKTLSDKQRLAEEMELLELETEDQLEVQKQNHDRPPNATDELLTSAPTSTKENGVSDLLDLPMPDADHAPSAATLTPSAREPVRSSSPTCEPDNQVDTQDGRRTSMPTLWPDSLDTSVLISGSPQVQEPTQLVAEETSETVAADHILEVALQESVRAEAESTTPSDADDMDTEDFYAPDPNHLAPVLNEAQLKFNRSPSYSPGLDDNIGTPNDDRDSVGDYEPPEAASPGENSPPFSPDPPKPLGSHHDQKILAESETSLAIDEGEVSEAESAMDLGAPVHDTDLDNSLPQENGSVPPMTEDLVVNHPEQQPRFTLYESPLRYFHAFRFHPEYNKQVPGGLRSLTYSHKIDAMTEFCPWELGGSCNDRACKFQHFRDIGLLDDGIVSALGNPAEFPGDQRALFCSGLKEVLTGLRARKIRDFDVIAQEVIAHRAEFLQDASKILILD